MADPDKVVEYWVAPLYDLTADQVATVISAITDKMSDKITEITFEPHSEQLHAFRIVSRREYYFEIRRLAVRAVNLVQAKLDDEGMFQPADWMTMENGFDMIRVLQSDSETRRRVAIQHVTDLLKAPAEPAGRRRGLDQPEFDQHRYPESILRCPVRAVWDDMVNICPPDGLNFCVDHLLADPGHRAGFLAQFQAVTKTSLALSLDTTIVYLGADHQHLIDNAVWLFRSMLLNYLRLPTEELHLLYPQTSCQYLIGVRTYRVTNLFRSTFVNLDPNWGAQNSYVNFLNQGQVLSLIGRQGHARDFAPKGPIPLQDRLRIDKAKPWAALKTCWHRSKQAWPGRAAQPASPPCQGGEGVIVAAADGVAEGCQEEIIVSGEVNESERFLRTLHYVQSLSLLDHDDDETVASSGLAHLPVMGFSSVNTAEHVSPGPTTSHASHMPVSLIGQQQQHHPSHPDRPDDFLGGNDQVSDAITFTTEQDQDQDQAPDLLHFSDGAQMPDPTTASAGEAAVHEETYEGIGQLQLSQRIAAPPEWDPLVHQLLPSSMESTETFCRTLAAAMRSATARLLTAPLGADKKALQLSIGRIILEDGDSIVGPENLSHWIVTAPEALKALNTSFIARGFADWTDRLTTFGVDADTMTLAKPAQGPAMWSHEPADLTITYELDCLEKSSRQLCGKILIDGDTFAVSCCEPALDKARIYVHGLRRTHDLKASVSWSDKTRADEAMAKFAIQIRHSMMVNGGDPDRLEIRLQEPQDGNTMLGAGRVRYAAKYADKQHGKVWLNITMVREMCMLEEGGGGLVYMTLPAGRVKTGQPTSWFEASLSSVAAEDVFRRLDWTMEDLIQAGTFKCLITRALAVLNLWDAIGCHNNNEMLAAPERPENPQHVFW